MIFVFDLDDTICETDAYSEKYIRDFLVSHKWPYKQVATAVRFAEAKFDWDRDTALAWYRKYGDKMMEEFPCKKGTVEFLQKIHDAGNKIVIATARANDWHTNPKEVTLRWLAKNKIPYDHVFIGRKDKEKICEEVNADFFVDDDLAIVEKVANYFGQFGNKKQAFLSVTNFNKDLNVPKNVIRISNFKEIEKFLNK